MRDIVIDQKGCHLTFDRQLLLLHHPSFTRPVSLPFSQIQGLTLVSSVTLGSNLLTKLAEQRIAVVILPSSGSGANGQACFVQGRWQAGVARRQCQYAVIHDHQKAVLWASKLVCLKIHRQAQLLGQIAKQKGINADTVIAQLNATSLSY